ncbi:sensor histidine kinase [Streptomyces sp. YC504]|uniref:histidine kinase n=1 Tax=Streptomyces mesophilus TaxID=1775132 RepID=A0A6G4XRV8_9ACTN|nr:sensor histidine kinase [Streptomyces mesophilus]
MTWRGRAADGVLAAVVCALVVATAPDGAGGPALALAVAGSLALAGYRPAPRVTLAVTTLCLSGYVALAEPGAAAALPVVGAVHTAARAGHRLVGAVAALLFLAVFAGLGEGLNTTLLLAGWFLCAVVTGLADQNWQAYLRQTEQRALDAERTREEVALRRAGEERLRIARELHDSLTHSIAVVKLQAGVAVHLARKRGEEVPPALLAIQEASGEAMRELRATLVVLRDPGPVARVKEVVERARAAGLSVTLTDYDGELPDEVQHTAYRIVQEALTNAARHAGASEVTVQLTVGDGQLEVVVADDGRADPDAGFEPGIGLTGMRERVEALGGTLECGPKAAGGFLVRAQLPLSVHESRAQDPLVRASEAK